MFILKGFCTISSLINNTPGTVNQVGELSSISRTFSKEQGVYQHQHRNDVRLVSFTCTNEGTKTPLTGTHKDNAFNVLTWVVEGCLNKSLPTETAAFHIKMTERFVLNEDQQVIVGDMVSDGTFIFPEFVEFMDLGAGNARYRIWFVDQSFQYQYDETEIVVIPPTEVVDDLHGDYSKVEPILKVADSVYLLNEANKAAVDNRPTVMKGLEYVWVDKTDPDNENKQLTSNWAVLIYGRAGDSLDPIQNALTDYILTNSVHQRDEWAKVLPGLFNPTEFYILPMWDNYAAPFQELKAGIYSPVIKYADAMSHTRKFGGNYTETFYEEQTLVLSALWRSLAFTSVGNPDSADAIFSLTQLFPDYMLIPTDKPDFNRMSPMTQKWVFLLNSMFAAAETMTDITNLDANFSRTKRDGKTYLSAKYETVTYHVLTKESFLQHKDAPVG